MVCGTLPDLERRISALETQLCPCRAVGNGQAATLQTCNGSGSEETSAVSTACQSAAQSSAGPSQLPSGGVEDPRVLVLEQRSGQIEDLVLAMEITITELKDSHKRIPGLLKKAQHLDDSLGMLQSRLDQQTLEEEAVMASIKRDLERLGQRVERWMRVPTERAQSCDSETSESMQSSRDQLLSEPAPFRTVPGSHCSMSQERNSILRRMEDSAVSNSMLQPLEPFEPPLDIESKTAEPERRPLVDAAEHDTKPQKPSRGNASCLVSLNHVCMWEPFADTRHAQSSGHLVESRGSRPPTQQFISQSESHKSAPKDSCSSLSMGQVPRPSQPPWQRQA